MGTLGQAFRGFFNINTIWALLILSSFFVCLAQHYLPSTSTIPAAQLDAGENTLVLRILDKKGEPRDYEFTVTREDDGLLLPPQPQAGKDRDAPWLIAVRRAGDSFLLTWDTRQTGTYELRRADAILDRGRLVTLQTLTDAAFDYAKIGFDIALGLVAAMVLFLGLMRVGQDAGLVQLVAKVLHPFIRWLFPDVPRDHPASAAILMNITTTILGLGNAATPFGLKAMKELQDLNPNKDVASDSQVMLLGYNTAGFALLPTTLLALRKSANCTDPFEIIGTCMIAGATSTVVAILAVKLLGRLPMFSLRAALAEARGQAAEKNAVAASEGAGR